MARATQQHTSPHTAIKPLSWVLPTIVGMLILTLVMAAFLRNRPSRPTSSTPLDSAVLARGEELYQLTCATCHGIDGSGYGNTLRAPALNGSEHSWHHPDEQIIGLLRQGGMQMPAVAATWSNDDVNAVLSYVKQWWSPQQRRAQRGSIGE